MITSDTASFLFYVNAQAKDLLNLDVKLTPQGQVGMY